MSLGLQLILTTTLVATPAGCSWAHPGANPYRGDPTHALADFDLPDATRRQLRRMMADHQPTDVVTITRDAIDGTHGYGDLREMHSGGGQVCHGEVDRSAWSATRRERALVYCAGDACVIVPDICHNVSLVTRRREREAVLDESPIDIEPAAGPPRPPADDRTVTPSDVAPPIAFLPTPEIGDSNPPGDGGGGGVPGGGFPGGGGGAPGGGFPGDGGGAPGGGFPGGGIPIGGGGGGIPCCDTGPIGPGQPGAPTSPPGVPPTSPVPEPSPAMLLLAGLALVLRRLRGRSVEGKSAATSPATRIRIP